MATRTTDLKVAIAGASGYTGAELLRLLANHPQVDVATITSETFAGKSVEEVFPSLAGHLSLTFKPLASPSFSETADFFFLALPHTKAMALVPSLLEKSKRVVDLSADFRLKDPDAYERWYAPHSASHLLKSSVYGLPEIHREDIAGASLVANPGCYPTGTILALAPVLKEKMVDLRSIVVTSLSGVSGAGRAPSLSSLFAEVGEGAKAYSVGEHRHAPEMEQELSLMAQEEVALTFVPHLVPMNRGILTTIHVGVKGGLSEEGIRQCYHSFYAQERFVRVCPPGVFPSTHAVRASNYCDIGMKLDRPTGRLIIVSAIDNLVKGASGQAVQNMNLMMGFDEGEGLTQVPVSP